VGVLAASNILDFDITLNGFGSPTVLTKSTSTMLVTGNDLIATPSSLSFTFTDTGFGRFVLVDQSSNSFGLLSAGFDLRDGGLFDIILNGTQNSILPKNVPTDSFTFATAAVPEPSTWAMMILGFGGLGFIAYRRRSKPTLIAI